MRDTRRQDNIIKNYTYTLSNKSYNVINKYSKPSIEDTTVDDFNIEQDGLLCAYLCVTDDFYTPENNLEKEEK